MKQLASSFNPAGRVPTVEPLRHVLQTTSSCRWEATGASPQGTEDNSSPAVFQLLLDPGRAATHREMRPQLVTSTHSCTLPALGPLLAQRCLSHPQPTYLGKSSLQRSLPSSAAHHLLPHSYLGEDWVLQLHTEIQDTLSETGQSCTYRRFCAILSPLPRPLEGQLVSGVFQLGKPAGLQER